MLSESDTKAKLIDPAIYKRGWTEDLIRREETAGAIEMGDTGPRRRPRPAHGLEGVEAARSDVLRETKERMFEA